MAAADLFFFTTHAAAAASRSSAARRSSIDGPRSRDLASAAPERTSIITRGRILIGPRFVFFSFFFSFLLSSFLTLPHDPLTLISIKEVHSRRFYR